MKKFFLLVILAITMAFTSVNAQSFSVTVNSIDFKYQGIDAANFCPAGSIVTANTLTRNITISKDNVQTFNATLKSIKKVNGNWVFNGIASDKATKNANVTVTLLSLTRAKLKVVLATGQVYNRTIKI